MASHTLAETRTTRMTMREHRHYDEFDGFVIIMGTDTMAYAASALSFMLENLGKSIIVTGSQVNPSPLTPSLLTRHPSPVTPYLSLKNSLNSAPSSNGKP